MSRLRPIEARRLIAFLVKQGFHAIGQTGSHVKLKRAGGAMLVVPRMPDAPSNRPVLKILKQAGLDPHLALDNI